jgi:hypothetical protein
VKNSFQCRPSGRATSLAAKAARRHSPAPGLSPIHKHPAVTGAILARIRSRYGDDAIMSDTEGAAGAPDTEQAGGAPAAEPVPETYKFFDLPLDKWTLFDSTTLKSSRIVLGSDLNPIIDFFNSADVGVGGRDAHQAAAELNLSDPDRRRLEALLRVRSYDVYTLRAALGNHLSPERFEQLMLPEGERRQLEEHTREYTRALFTIIFEDSGIEASNRQAMRDLLEGSTKEIVQRNVMGLAQKFAIKPTELVNYIAGVGEMLLAIAYYRRAFDYTRLDLHTFIREIKTLHEHQFVVTQHPDLPQNTSKILALGARTSKLLDSYFDSFNGIGQIWENLTPERFRKIREAIERQYPIIGSTLCIWQVKLDAWNKRFHRTTRRDSSPVQFATFFQERIFPNFEKIQVHLDRIRNFDKSMRF